MLRRCPRRSALVPSEWASTGVPLCEHTASCFLHRHPGVDQPRAGAPASGREQGFTWKRGVLVLLEAGLSRALPTVAADDPPDVNTRKEKMPRCTRHSP